MQHLDPIFKALAPGKGDIPPTPGRDKAKGTAEEGYLHCGPSGAGHFVKMVHNGIEYGIMAAFAEGFNILKHANAGSAARLTDAETAPMRNPEHYMYDLPLADVAEVWRRGSVVASWLLDLTAIALFESPDLANFSGHVSDSGEGRWTVLAAVDESTPAPVLSAALFSRFTSRGEEDFANRLALRHALPIRRPRGARRRRQNEVSDAKPTAGSQAAQASAENHGKPADRCVMVIFGASGDLTKRKLIPSLYHLAQKQSPAQRVRTAGLRHRKD